MGQKPQERIDEDAPEATAEWFAKARPAGEVLAGLLGNDVAREMLKPKRGRPALAQAKAHDHTRMDADVVGVFNATIWLSRFSYPSWPASTYLFTLTDDDKPTTQTSGGMLKVDVFRYEAGRAGVVSPQTVHHPQSKFLRP